MLSLLNGFLLALKHLFRAFWRAKPVNVDNSSYYSQDKGLVTLLYPSETISVPTNGRYQLYNEIEDCIVCDKCAKVCPVDCIEIIPIKATEEIGKTSDGTTKRLYAATFDIDMAKCCYCGLCTTVCPTECLTMTADYDYAVTNVADLTFSFGNLVDQEIEALKVKAADALKAAEALKAAKAIAIPVGNSTTASDTDQAILPSPKPVAKPFRPFSAKPKPNTTTDAPLQKPE